MQHSDGNCEKCGYDYDYCGLDQAFCMCRRPTILDDARARLAVMRAEWFAAKDRILRCIEVEAPLDRADLMIILNGPM